MRSVDCALRGSRSFYLLEVNQMKFTHSHRILRVTFAFALFSISCVLVSEPVHATTPGIEGRIVYMHKDRLEIVAANGTQHHVLRTPCRANDPSWAPGGSVILFTRNCGGATHDDIAFINADGTGLTTILATAAYEFQPVLSPDGTRLAYARWSNADGSSIYVADADGSNPISLTPETQKDLQSPTWSPDGSQLAYLMHSHIYLMNADGTQRHRFEVGSVDWDTVDWSPDGRRIAFSAGGDLVWALTSGKGGVQRMTAGNSIAGRVNDAGWSPDGTEVVFNAGKDVMLMNSDGSDQRWLRRGKSPAWEPVSGLGDAAVWFAGPKKSLREQVTLDGGLSIPDLSPASQVVNVYATPPGGSRSLIGSPTTDSDDNFTFDTTPDLLGKWHYDVEWPGDVSHDPATYGRDVEVTKIPTELKLQPASRNIKFGESTSLTATINSGPPNVEMSILRLVPKPPVEVETGQTHHGKFTIRVTPTRNTTYTATTPESDEYQGGRSRAQQVSVRYSVTAEAIDSDRHAGQFAIYSYTPDCRTHHKGCPTFTAKVRPARPGDRVSFRTQSRGAVGGWKNVSTEASRLDRHSVGQLVQTYRGQEVIGVDFRVRATKGYGKGLASGTSRWLYYRVAK